MSWVILLIQLLPSIIKAVQAILELFKYLPKERRVFYRHRFRALVLKYRYDRKKLLDNFRVEAAKMEREATTFRVQQED